MDIDAVLADHAEVSGGKLFVNGAGISLIATPLTAPPFVTSFALAAVLTIPWTATNQQHRLTVELISEDSETGQRRIPIGDQLAPGQEEADRGIIVAAFNAGRAPHMLVGEATLLPLALPLSLPLPQLGSYFFDLTIDGSQEKRLSFRLVNVTQLQGMPGLTGQTGPYPA